jgi:hypothetical protein
VVRQTFQLARCGCTLRVTCLNKVVTVTRDRVQININSDKK